MHTARPRSSARPSSRTWSRTSTRSDADNRSEVFAMDLPEGSHRFTYTVRATTPGDVLRRAREGRGDVQPGDLRPVGSDVSFPRCHGTDVVNLSGWGERSP